MNKQARMREAFGAAGPRRLKMIAVPILGAPADPTIDLERVETALRELAGPTAKMLVPGADPLDLWGPWLGTEDQRAHPAASPQVTSVFQAAMALALGGDAAPDAPAIAMGGDVVVGGKRLPVLAGDHLGLAGFTLSGADAVALAGAALVIEQGVEDHAAQVAPLDYSETDAADLFASLEGMARALDLLAEAGLADWVRASTNRFVAVSDGAPYAGRYSVCGPELPSTVYLDARGGMADLIESIVHEASHQQLFLLELDRPLVLRHVLTPSPFRSGLRSLRRVLAGAHAFANSIHALKLTLTAADPRVAARIGQLERKLAASLQILEGHEALSPVAVGILARIRAVHDLPRFRPPPRDVTGMPQDVASPWSWREDKSAWYANVPSLLALWQPQNISSPGAARLRETLLAAAEERADWLFHPSMGSVFGAKGAEEVDLLRWVARHVPELSDVAVRLDAPLLLWTEDGGRQLSPGLWQAADLAGGGTEGGLHGPFDLDSLGRFFDRDPSELVPDAGFAGDLGRLFQALDQVTAMPDMLAWLQHVTRVLAVPSASPRRSLRSLSHPLVPGAIFLEIFGGMSDTVELMVHESAHQMLFLAEAGGDLVDPGHQQLYWSPLRRDPRPLRGILLAYHALCYICAAQADLVRAGALDARHIEGLSEMIYRAELAGRVLEGGRKGLTPRGLDFFERTREVLRHAG